MIIIGAILSQVNRSQWKSTKPLPYSRFDFVQYVKINIIGAVFVDFCYFLLLTFPVFVSSEPTDVTYSTGNIHSSEPMFGM